MLINGIHLEPTNICTLKCPACPRTRFIEQWPHRWQNHSLDIDILFRFLDVDLNGKNVLLCGNYGDPIYHPNLLGLVAGLKTRGMKVSITTNGSYQKQNWWQQLVSVLDQQDTITFSVDGSPENFTEYRVNGDWSSILVGMQVVAQARCHSIWKYIPFSYNQQHIDQTRQLSQNLGIRQFMVDPSARFDQRTQWLQPVDNLIKTSFEPQEKWKSGQRDLGVDPKCHDNKRHFITAQGYYSPCCYSALHSFYYKNQFGQKQHQYDIRLHTLSELLQRQDVIDFNQTLSQHSVCQFNCPRETVYETQKS